MPVNFFSPNTPIDPKKALKLEQQKAYADALLQQGADPVDLGKYQIGGVAYARSPFEDLAKVLQSGLGGYESKKNQEEYGKEAENSQKAYAEALRAMGTGGIDAGIAASADSPYLAEFGKDLAMSKAKSDYEVNKLMAIEKFKYGLNPLNQMISGGTPPNSYQGLPEPSVSSQPLPPPAGMKTDMNLPPLPAGALRQPAPMSGSVPMPPNPNQAMGAMVDAQGNQQPPAAFDAAPQPQFDTAYSAAVEKQIGAPPSGESYMWQRGADGRPIEVKNPSYAPKVTGELAQKNKDAGAYYGGLMNLLDEIDTGASKVSSDDRLAGVAGIQSPNYTDTQTKIDQAHMLMKEMYNLGVLNGPDLELMRGQLSGLSDPRSIMNGPEFTKIQVKNAKKIFTDILGRRGIQPQGAVNQPSQERISVITPDGKQGTIDPAHLDDLLKAGGKRM